MNRVKGPVTRNEAELLAAFKNGGAVVMQAPSRDEQPAMERDLRAAYLAQLLCDFSKRSLKRSDCSSVQLTDFDIKGKLDLSSQGLEGSPLLASSL